VVDLATVAATFGDRLHSAGIPVTPERSGRFAAAIELTTPATYADLYWTARITLITADTGQTPNEGYTAGSQSMQHSGTAVLNAAAQVRGILMSLAAQRFSAPVNVLTVQNGVVQGPAGRTATYASLVAGVDLHVRASAQSPLTDPSSRRVVEKLAIREEGVAVRYLEINGIWEDHVRYAITAEEWDDRREDLMKLWVD